MPKPKDPALVAFGARLREIRIKRGFHSQQDLARRIAHEVKATDPHETFAQANISNYENGISAPSIKYFRVISRVLSISIVVGSESLEIVEKNGP